MNPSRLTFFFLRYWDTGQGSTAGGSETRRSPVERGSFFPMIYKVLYIPGGCLGFLPSIVA